MKTGGSNMVYALFSLGLLAAVGAVYTAAIGWLWFRQERLLFEPTPLAADHVLSTDPDVQELTIDVPGARLSAAHLRLPDPRGVVFFLHGNSGNLVDCLVDLDYGTKTITLLADCETSGTLFVPDGWTVVTRDHSLSAQWEHTVLVTPNGYEVLTLSAGTPAAPAFVDMPHG